MWSLMRWPFPRFILLALGGVIPLLSFFMETRVARDVKDYLAQREAAGGSAGTASATDATTRTSTTTPEGSR